MGASSLPEEADSLAGGRPGRKCTYPFAELLMNQKFLTNAPLGRIAAAACQYGKYHDKKFKCRTMVDGRIQVERVK